MKKITLIFNFVFFLLYAAFPQTGMWTWMKGDGLYNQAGTFGTQGIPSPSNNPPGFYEPSDWQDQQGNFWLYGGFNGGIHDDVWRFDPVTNEWTWMKGSGTTSQIPVYGTQGVSSILNTPGNQQWCSATWVDTSGNFWLFGGSDGAGTSYNLLWKYDLSTNEWTWMKGSTTCCQPAVYGTAGVPDPANEPASDWETSATWVDSNNNLWFFGGYNSGNDLWKYNIATNMWTWMSPANLPSSRQAYSKWKDSNENFWLFGGGNASSSKNDLWKYVIVANQWLFMDGSQTINDSGSYTSVCFQDTLSNPSARTESRACWTDNENNFWLFGGYSSQGALNDLWKYCPSGKIWTWVNGSQATNQPAVFGTQGIPNINNVPSSRMGSVGWKDLSGNLWLYSGWAGSTLGNAANDLWRYTIDTTCGICPNTTNITENNPTEADDLLVFPNPTNSSLTISFSSSEKQTVELRIYNTLGKQIYFTKEEITKGKFEKEINVKKWSNGIYFLQVKMKEGNMNRKVIVNH